MLSRDNFTLERASRALALCGAADEVSRLSGELAERFPNATQTDPHPAASGGCGTGRAARRRGRGADAARTGQTV